MTSLAEQGAPRLTAICRAVGLDAGAPRMLELWTDMLGPARDRSVDEPPAWPSDVCDDHGPFEFSISTNESRTAVRALVETSGGDHSMRARQDAGAAMTRALATRLGLCLERLERVEDLFLLASPRGRLSRWHAIELREQSAFDVKVYFDTRVRGERSSRFVVEELLARLGHPDARADLNRILSRGDRDMLTYAALDLASRPSARLKVYVAHRDVTCAELESMLTWCRDYDPGDATAFCHAMIGSRGPFSAKPVSTTYSWVEHEPRPSATIHVPIRAYVTDDRVAYERILAYMDAQGLPTRPVEHAVGSFANRPLEHGVGMLTYASLKKPGGTPNVAVYMCPETYRVAPRRGENVDD